MILLVREGKKSCVLSNLNYSDIMTVHISRGVNYPKEVALFANWLLNKTTMTQGKSLR